MAGRSESARPAIAAAALLVVLAAALRGHLPGTPDTPRTPPARDSGGTALVIAMLVLAIGVVLLAVVVRARRRVRPPAASAAPPEWMRGELGRPSWRALLIVFAVLATTIVCALLLGGLTGRTQPQTASNDAPAGTTATGAPRPPDGPDGPRPPHEKQDAVLGYLAGAAAVFLVAVVIGSLAATRRRGAPASSSDADAASPQTTERGAQTLARAAEVALAEVEDHGRDPRAAIIACYTAMERELARVPEVVPREWDTASEVLARAVEYQALGPDTATVLVDLFDEARFSRHVMGEGHRDVAAAALQRVLDELRVRA